MIVSEYIELEQLRQRLKEINACILRCKDNKNHEDEFLLIHKYKKPTEDRIKAIELL